MFAYFAVGYYNRDEFLESVTGGSYCIPAGWQVIIHSRNGKRNRIFKERV